MEAISPELFAQIKSIQIRSQRLVNANLAGEWSSAFKGRGMEFEEVREYQPGDDVRTLDWNVTARSGIPHVKIYREERELTVMLMVDLSGSGDFGSGKRLKREVIAEVAALLAYTAIRSNDRVGLMTFSDQVEHYVPPKKGRAHVWRVIREVLTARAERRGTHIGGALEHLARTQRRPCVVFLISDFLDHDYVEALRLVAKRHDLTAVTVTDPRERELPRVGLVELVDAETGEQRLVDTLSRKAQTEFSRAAVRQERTRGQQLQLAGVGHIPVRTDRSTIEPILRYFRAR
ncbi:MAG: DUF58 domain-containing protein [Myxococcota bacterium]